MAVVLAELLQAEHVTLDLRAESREAALREIVATMELTEPERFLAEVLAREKLHTTLMSKGVAFPHARTDLVPQITVGIGRSVEGVRFGENGELAHLIFIIAVPKRMINDYLVCVGALARITKGEETRAELMRLEMPTEFVEVLRTGSLLLE